MIQCKGCKSHFSSLEIKKYSKDNYCLKCYDLKVEEEAQRQKLIGYICQIFNIDRPTPMMFGQIKNFKTKDKISYEEQRQTLFYLVERVKMDLDIKYGIGIVRYKYDEMLYYKKQAEKERLKQEKKTAENKKINTDAVIIQIKQKTNEQTYRDRNMINPSDWGINKNE